MLAAGYHGVCIRISPSLCVLKLRGKTEKVDACPRQTALVRKVRESKPWLCSQASQVKREPSCLEQVTEPAGFSCLSME